MKPTKVESPGPSLLVEDRAIDAVRPYEGNPRVNDAAVAAVAHSIGQFGFRQPIVVDTAGTIVVGHTRWKAAKSLGMATVPVHVAHGLTDAQIRAYRIADNRVAELAEWDLKLLPVELSALKEQGIDVQLLGFSEEDLDHLLPPASLADPDAVPEVPKTAVTKPGDLWRLDRHRLLCGDSTDAAMVRRLLAGAKPHLMVTDPPYGVEYDATWRRDAGINKSAQMGAVRNDERASWAAAFRHFPGAIAYVWHAAKFASVVERSLLVLGFEIRAQVVWVKKRFAISRGHYHWRHEPCWYAVRGGSQSDWVGGRKQGTVWADIVDAFPRADLFAARVDEQTILAFDGSATTVWEIGHDKAAGGGHSTQKPVECMARPIRHHGKKGEGVFEPFMGSGTTLIACEMLERRCFGMELDPCYCDAIVARWEQFTGRKATRESR